METCEVIIICLLALFICISIFMLTDVKEKIRRKKHPAWYEYYDRALANSLHIGNKFRCRIEYINKRKEIFQKKFFEGECTEAEFNDVIDALNREYKEATRQFSIDKEAYDVETDLKAADAYAKEYNLKWGIIYK